MAAAAATTTRRLQDHPSVYLLPSRPWLYKLGLDGFAAVPDDVLDGVCADVDVLWLQGAWEVGPAGRDHDLRDPGRMAHFRDCLPDFTADDCIGSPYAVTRYVPSPALGSDEDLAAFRRRLASRGVRLMLDFVPNHTARDSPWAAGPRPGGLYVLDGDNIAYGRDPYSGDWTDTAQLNYWSEQCREHMANELMGVADRCDAVRVDMAMLCCNEVIERTWGCSLRERGFERPAEEFWPWALERVRQRHPNFALLAECYEYEQIFPEGTGRLLLRQGFDCVYDKVLYDRLAGGHMDNLRGHLAGDAELPSGRLCHFIENHDEERAAVHFGARAAAAALAALTLPGPRLLMWGQELGLRARLAVQLRRSRDEDASPDLAAFHRKLLHALPLCRGDWSVVPLHGEGAWRLIAWAWRRTHKCSDGARAEAMEGPPLVLVVVNYTDGEAWAHAAVADLLPAVREGTPGSQQRQQQEEVCFEDVLAGARYTRSLPELRGPDGLVVGLKPFDFHLFFVGPA